MNEKLCEILAEYDRISQERHEERMEQARTLRAATAQTHQRWLEVQEAAALKLERHERKRALVRHLMMTFVEPHQCEEIPLTDILWFTIRYCAGVLACCELSDPVDLRLRRLGREMQSMPIEF